MTIKQFTYWAVAILALLALAGPLPDVATLFVVLLIAGVLLTHWREYIQIFGVEAGGQAHGKAAA